MSPIPDDMCALLTLVPRVRQHHELSGFDPGIILLQAECKYCVPRQMRLKSGMVDRGILSSRRRCAGISKIRVYLPPSDSSDRNCRILSSTSFKDILENEKNAKKTSGLASVSTALDFSSRASIRKTPRNFRPEHRFNLGQPEEESNHFPASLSQK